MLLAQLGFFLQRFVVPVLLAGLCTCAAWSQPINAIEPALAAPVQLLRILALTTNAHTNLQAVQADSAYTQWKEFSASRTYALSEGKALWLQLQLTVATPEVASGWRIKASKPFIDRIEVYSAAPNGTWKVQAAGDQVASLDWPVRNLNPQFLLPGLAAGEHTVWIKVVNGVSVNFEIVLQSDKDANTSNLDDYVRSALPIVLILCMAFISAFLAMAFRRPIYLIYSLYAVFAAAAAAAYTGFGQLLLWPAASRWPEISIHLLTLMAHIALTVFGYATFEPQKLLPRFQWLFIASLCISIISIPVMLLSSHIVVYTVAFFAGMLASWVMLMSVIFVRLRLGELAAMLWALAYVPLAVSILIAALDNFGLTQQALFGYYWPLYCLVFEIPLLLLALMLRAKTQHALAIDQQVRQQLDPLTGFIVPRAYNAAATAMWEQASSQGNDLAVVYVQTYPPADLPMALGMKMPAKQNDRIVRVLRTVFRAHDMYAQVSRNVYAVWMPKTTSGDDLQVRLTRVVAQMHMLNHETDKRLHERIRIVACNNDSLALPWPQAHQALLNKLNADMGWGKRNIRYVKNQNLNFESSPNLSDFWQYALDASTANSPMTPPKKPQ